MNRWMSGIPEHMKPGWNLTKHTDTHYTVWVPRDGIKKIVLGQGRTPSKAIKEALENE